MTVIDWRDERDSRTHLYGSRRLNPFHTIAITGDPDYLASYPGQCAAIILGNLLSRMTPAVVLAFPNRQLHPNLSWLGADLHGCMIKQMRGADPHGYFRVRTQSSSDYLINVGAGDANIKAVGSGWLAYAGPGPAPFSIIVDDNPFGAMFAAILAAAQLFIGRFPVAPKTQFVNTLTWATDAGGGNPPLENASSGRLMGVGLGSVGSAAMYFLALASARFSADLIDHDVVKTHNLDRSPIFTDDDAENKRPKVVSTERFLNGAGIRGTRSDANPLHQSALWAERQAGEPDILISAANEMDVRRFIELAFPPLQIYATTGQNWQASLIRHIPMIEACSLCLFPIDRPSSPTLCATAPAAPANFNEKPRPDAALPFLSFAAGLMTAAEIMKLNMRGYPFCRQRVTLSFRPDIHMSHTDIMRIDDCDCTTRSQTVYADAIRATQHFGLSLAKRAERQSA